MEKILILGCGYLGYNLANFLSEKFDVTVINKKKNLYSEASCGKFKFCELDFTDIDKLYDFDLKEYIVINALGSISPTTNINGIDEELKFYNTLTSLLLYISKRDVQRIIHISSGGTVYGDKAILPISEDQTLEPTNIYALQKVFFEGFLKVNFIENKIPYTILRISNPFGGYQTPNKQQGLIPIIIRNIIQNREMEFWTDLNTIRDYIYISDLVRAFEIVINNASTKNKIYNVASGVGTTILEVIELCEKVTNAKLNYAHIQKNVGLVNKNILDITNIKNLGFSVDIPLEMGIKKEYERIINCK